MSWSHVPISVSAYGFSKEWSIEIGVWVPRRESEHNVLTCNDEFLYYGTLWQEFDGRVARRASGHGVIYLKLNNSCMQNLCVSKQALEVTGSVRSLIVKL